MLGLLMTTCYLETWVQDTEPTRLRVEPYDLTFLLEAHPWNTHTLFPGSCCVKNLQPSNLCTLFLTYTASNTPCWGLSLQHMDSSETSNIPIITFSTCGSVALSPPFSCKSSGVTNSQPSSRWPCPSITAVHLSPLSAHMLGVGPTHRLPLPTLWVCPFRAPFFKFSNLTLMISSSSHEFSDFDTDV